jgi:hypothetical protein
MRTTAAQRRAAGDMPHDLHADGERSRRGIAPDQGHAVSVRKIRKTAGKPLEPVRIGGWQGQGQGGPGRSRTHRRQVAQIHGQRTVAYRSGVAIVREMAAGDYGIHRRRQFRILRHAQQCRVIPHP